MHRADFLGYGDVCIGRQIVLDTLLDRLVGDTESEQFSAKNPSK